MQNKDKIPGFLAIAAIIIFSVSGVITRYFTKKNGVYIIATILEVNSAPRGRYGATIKYSYMYRPYQKVVSFNEDFINMKSVGKKLIFVILPNNPTTSICIDEAPDCLGDNPPEGWTEIPECD